MSDLYVERNVEYGYWEAHRDDIVLSELGTWPTLDAVRTYLAPFGLLLRPGGALNRYIVRANMPHVASVCDPAYLDKLADNFAEYP